MRWGFFVFAEQERCVWIWTRLHCSFFSRYWPIRRPPQRCGGSSTVMYTDIVHTDFTENTLKHSSTRVLTLWSNTLSIREKLESNVQPLGPIVLSSTPSVLCCVACIVQRSRGCKLILKTEYQTACLIQFVCSVRVIHTLLMDNVEMVVKRQFLLWYILFFLLLIFYNKRIALLCILYGCVSCVIVKYY